MNPTAWATAVAALMTTHAMADVQVVSPKSDAQNYKGDEVSFGADLTAKVVKLGSAAKPADGCVATGTELRGLGTVAIAVNDGKDAEQRPLFQVLKPGKSTDSTRTTLTVVKDSFQLGLVIGAHRVAKSANYANNGQSWASLSRGFDFYN